MKIFFKKTNIEKDVVGVEPQRRKIDGFILRAGRSTGSFLSLWEAIVTSRIKVSRVAMQGHVEAERIKIVDDLAAVERIKIVHMTPALQEQEMGA